METKTDIFQQLTEAPKGAKQLIIYALLKDGPTMAVSIVDLTELKKQGYNDPVSLRLQWAGHLDQSKE